MPDAPFKTTWHELAFKRMVRWAAEAGTIRIPANEFTKVDLVSDGKAFRPA